MNGFITNILSSTILHHILRKNEENIFANASPGIPAVCTVCQTSG